MNTPPAPEEMRGSAGSLFASLLAIDTPRRGLPPVDLPRKSMHRSHSGAAPRARRIPLISMLIFVLLGLGLYHFSPQITGFVTKEFAYSEPANLVVASSGSYQWTPENAGELLSLRIDGSLTNNGTARVYLESNGAKKLVFDSSRLGEASQQEQENATPSGLGAITALVIGTATEDAPIEEEPAVENSIPQWGGESSFTITGETTIPLGGHFTDADGDTLSYTSTSPLNVGIIVDGSTLTVVPDEDFTGSRTAFVTASDGKANTTQAITLIIGAELALSTNEDEEPLSTANASDSNETTTDNDATEPEQEESLAPPSNETSAPSNGTEPTEDNATEEPSTTEKSISLGLSYGDNPLYDINNDGIETLNGVIDLSVAGTSFNWEADASKLCTRWTIASEDEGTSEQVCYGSPDCCAFVDLPSSADGWNTTYYSTFARNGETESNRVSAQVISYDVNLSVESLKSEIAYSSWQNLTAKYTTGYMEFSSACIDTCSLTGFNRTSYKLIFELEGEVVLRLNNLIYKVRQDVANAPPVAVSNFSNMTILKNRNATINLSSYFSDPDGDALSYSAFDADNLSVVFDGDVATIVPDKGFAGTRFTYIRASDGSNSVSSNIFRIAVNDTDRLTPRIEVGQPVTWVKRVSIANGTSELETNLPKGTLNFTVLAVTNESLQEVSEKSITVLDEGREKTKQEFEEEQASKEADRALSILDEAVRKGADRVVLSEENFTSSEIPGKRREAEQRKDAAASSTAGQTSSSITGRAIGVSSLTGFAIFDDSSSSTEAAPEENATITIEDIPAAAREVEVVYTTQAPLLIETPQWNGKELFISSEASYTDVFVSTDIRNTMQDNIHVYWVQNNTRTEFPAVDMIDSDLDGLVDRLEWYVPHLSNQTFEIALTILNVQSYPTVGGNWTVLFNTTGVGNLTVMASNGTTYGELYDDNEITANDLVPLEISCGNSTLEPLYIVDISNETGNLSLAGLTEISGAVVREFSEEPAMQFSSFQPGKEHKEGKNPNLVQNSPLNIAAISSFVESTGTSSCDFRSASFDQMDASRESAKATYGASSGSGSAPSASLRNLSYNEIPRKEILSSTSFHRISNSCADNADLAKHTALCLSNSDVTNSGEKSFALMAGNKYEAAESGFMMENRTLVSKTNLLAMNQYPSFFLASGESSFRSRSNRPFLAFLPSSTDHLTSSFSSSDSSILPTSLRNASRFTFLERNSLTTSDQLTSAMESIWRFKSSDIDMVKFGMVSPFALDTINPVKAVNPYKSFGSLDLSGPDIMDGIADFLTLIPSVAAVHLNDSTYQTIIINGKEYALLTKAQLEGHSYPVLGVFYPDYSCENLTGRWTVQVLTPGVHNQQFTFSGEVAYAHNFASVNDSNVTISPLYPMKDRNATLIVNASATGVISRLSILPAARYSTMSMVPGQEISGT